MKKIILFLMLFLLPALCSAKTIFPETSIYTSDNKVLSVFSTPQKTVVELQAPNAIYVGVMDTDNERMVMRWEGCADDDTFTNWIYPLSNRKNEIVYNVILHNQDIIISPVSGKHSVTKTGKAEISGKYIRKHDKRVSASPVTAVYFIGLSDAKTGKDLLLDDISEWIINKPDKETKDVLEFYPLFIEIKKNEEDTYLVAEDLSLTMKN